MTITAVGTKTFGDMARRCEAAATAHEEASRCAYLGIVLARRYPETKAHLIAGVVVRLQPLAAIARADGEALCNGDFEGENERTATREGAAADLLADMRLIFGENDFVIRFSGLTTHLKIPGLRGDGWTPEEGFAVYGGRVSTDEEG